MQAVGRIGSYISKSVYTVSGPFHPFGGAVDIIVVEQPDGSYKSSPWYVRFGKFQGVLKTREKVVNINVNGVEADFHMLLNHKGEAYFLKDVDEGEEDSVCSPPSSSGEDTGRQCGNRLPIESNNCNYDANWAGGNKKPVVGTKSRPPPILGLVFGRRPRKENGVPEDNGSDVIRTDSLERAEIAADLLDLKWSTNLDSPRLSNDNASRASGGDINKDGNENLSVDNGIGAKCLSSEVVVETVTSTGKIGEVEVSNSETLVLNENSDSAQEVHILDSVAVVSEMVEPDSQIQDSKQNQNGSFDSSFFTEENSSDNVICYHSETSKSSGVVLEGSVEQTDDPVCHRGDGEVYFHAENAHILRPSISSEVKSKPEDRCPTIQKRLGHRNLIRDLTICRDGGPLFSDSQNFVTESYSEEISHQRGHDFIQKVEVQSVVTILEEDQTNNHRHYFRSFGDPQSPGSEVIRRMLSSGTSEEEELLFGKMDDSDSSEAKDSEPLPGDKQEKETGCSCSTRVSDGINDDMPKRRLRNMSSFAYRNTSGLVQPESMRQVRSLPSMSSLSSNFDQAAPPQSTAEDGRNLYESKAKPASKTTWIPPRPIDSFRGNPGGGLFSSKRARSMRDSRSIMDGGTCPNGKILEKSISDPSGIKDAVGVNINKNKVRTNVPTSEQLASLNLKEGKNIVVFTFSTAMLGKQQVDARIFLWRWDARIVISDVDGTITRSDLLGQVMPLVGMDWSQTGVAHLFTAIKENGYQLLFLSARSISQAFHTRQFLFNIKQDGKALPEGPVVISPDGLFPSLFREVVRRAPHEFKIACLEDIKALFPTDTSPFYAGFGNRDTDEFSYLKVGIPRNKIFIINPKGEIVVNRRLDTKSYSSLHTLVHGMFPTMSSSEQEDFNSWNYWKLPPPTIDV